MVYSGNQVLVQNRTAPDWPGISFPGGHIEPGESFSAAVVREVFEETGLTIVSPHLCGVKEWENEDGSRYIVLFYKTDRFSGELKSSSEGKVFWIHRKDLDNYVLAEGFESMLEVFENDALSENYHWLENGEWQAKNL